MCALAQQSLQFKLSQTVVFHKLCRTARSSTVYKTESVSVKGLARSAAGVPQGRTSSILAWCCDG